MARQTFGHKLELLETRRLLANATLSASGDLLISGRNNVNDAVIMSLNPSGDRINLELGSRESRSFAKSKIRSISFYGQGGDDSLIVNENAIAFDLDVNFYGGDGNDVIIGSTGFACL